VCGDFPKPSQPDGSIAPCRPTRSPATGSVGMADVIAFCPRGGGEQLLFMSLNKMKYGHFGMIHFSDIPIC
jgi:hypothetical protein